MSSKPKAVLFIFMVLTLSALPPLTYACGDDPYCHWHCHPKTKCHKPPHHGGGRHPKPPIIVKPPPVSPPVIVKPPPVIVKPPPVSSPPIIVKPPPVSPPVVVKPPPVSPPVIVIPPPVSPPVIINPPPVVPSPPYYGVPSPPPQAKCPIDALKLGLCLDVLGGLVHVGIGNPIENICCPVIQGLLDLEAAICLCTVIRLKLLNLNIFVPLALQVLATCGLTPPPGFVCPPLV